MDETELIENIVTLLDDTVSVPVRTGALEEERPVPSVIVEDWNTTDLNFNNSAKAGEAYGDFNSNGTKTYEWYLNFSFETRVEILFRHSDEVAVSELKEKVKQQFQLLGENPLEFHDDLKRCDVGRGGNPQTNFVESNESELMLSVDFHGDHTVTRTANKKQNNPINNNTKILQSVIETFTFDNS